MGTGRRGGPLAGLRRWWLGLTPAGRRMFDTVLGVVLFFSVLFLFDLLPSHW